MFFVHVRSFWGIASLNDQQMQNIVIPMDILLDLLPVPDWRADTLDTTACCTQMKKMILYQIQKCSAIVLMDVWNQKWLCYMYV